MLIIVGHVNVTARNAILRFEVIHTAYGVKILNFINRWTSTVEDKTPNTELKLYSFIKNYTVMVWNRENSLLRDCNRSLIVGFNFDFIVVAFCFDLNINDFRNDSRENVRAQYECTFPFNIKLLLYDCSKYWALAICMTCMMIRIRRLKFILNYWQMLKLRWWCVQLYLSWSFYTP